SGAPSGRATATGPSGTGGATAGTTAAPKTVRAQAATPDSDSGQLLLIVAGAVGVLIAGAVVGVAIRRWPAWRRRS
ncbi:MAG: hypothetical protein ACRDMZ_21300, partial [Solirubrobacteraceae bacterium]